MLSEDWVEHLAVHVGQPKIPTAEAIRQPLVIDSEQMQYRRMQIVHRADILSSEHAEFIGRSVAESLFDATATHERSETVVIVVATLLAL